MSDDGAENPFFFVEFEFEEEEKVKSPEGVKLDEPEPFVADCRALLSMGKEGLVS